MDVSASARHRSMGEICDHNDLLCKRIAELEAENARLRELLKEGADDLVHYIDIEYPYRDKYPHVQAKWELKMEIVNRMSDAIQESGDGS